MPWAFDFFKSVIFMINLLFSNWFVRLSLMEDEKLIALGNSLKQYKRSTLRSKVPKLGERLSSASGDLGHLVHNLNRINRLNQIFSDLLESPISEHTKVAQFRENILVLAVDSGQWASRLRFEKLNLLTKLRQNGFSSISSIEIIVQPADFT